VLHNAIVNQTPLPVRSLNPQVPAELENIINKAIEKDREARYLAATEMRADLRIAPAARPETLAARKAIALARRP
jgi:hypothetical protein